MLQILHFFVSKHWFRCFTPLCSSMCEFKWLIFENIFHQKHTFKAFPQSGTYCGHSDDSPGMLFYHNENGSSPVWRSLWLLRIPLAMNLLSQKLQDPENDISRAEMTSCHGSFLLALLSQMSQIRVLNRLLSSVEKLVALQSSSQKNYNSHSSQIRRSWCEIFISTVLVLLSPACFHTKKKYLYKLKSK